MKSKDHPSWIMAAFVILLAGTSVAEAFYDPNCLGRWLNRDPILERGGINVYQMARSNPLSFVDSYGHEIGNINRGWIDPPQKKCPDENCNPFTITSRALDAQNRNFNLVLQPDPYQGGYRHCVAACLLGRCFGNLGNAATYLRDALEEDDSENSAADILGEQRGMDFAKNSSKSCEQACLESYPPMQGPPAPPLLRPPR